jgi:hypothetical protein
MLIAVIVIGGACAFYFFLFQPGLERLEALEKEAMQAEELQQEYDAVIAQGIGASEQIAEAKDVYKEARKRLFTRMTPEALDSMVTGFFVKAGFDPQALTMSPLTPEVLIPFVSAPLVPELLTENPEPQAEPAAAEEEQAAPEDAEGTDAASVDDSTGDDSASDVRVTPVDIDANITGALTDTPFAPFFLTAYADETVASLGDIPEGDASLEGEASSEDGAEGEGEGETAEPEARNNIYSYSLNVTVDGGWSNLRKLLSRVAKVESAEIMSFSYSEAGGGGEEESSGSFSIVMKLYVFIENEVQSAPSEDAPVDGAVIDSLNESVLP